MNKKQIESFKSVILTLNTLFNELTERTEKPAKTTQNTPGNTKRGRKKQEEQAMEEEDNEDQDYHIRRKDFKQSTLKTPVQKTKPAPAQYYMSEHTLPQHVYVDQHGYATHQYAPSYYQAPPTHLPPYSPQPILHRPPTYLPTFKASHANRENEDATHILSRGSNVYAEGFNSVKDCYGVDDRPYDDKLKSSKKSQKSRAQTNVQTEEFKDDSGARRKSATDKNTAEKDETKSGKKFIDEHRIAESDKESEDS